MKKIGLSLIFILGMTTLLSANIFTSFKSGSVNGLSTLEGKLETGADLIIINSDSFIEAGMESRSMEVIDMFSIITMESIRVTYDRDGLTTFDFIPETLSWNGVDINSHLTSGFSIKLTETVAYEVDIFVDKLHLHVNGYYEDEESLLNKITNIIQHPGDFLLSRDPEHIMNNFNKLETLIIDLQKENELLRAELTELKYNNLVMESRGLFGTIKSLNRDDINWIIEQKSNNMSLTSEKIIEMLMAERGSKVTGNIVELIFGLYFGEYNS